MRQIRGNQNITEKEKKMVEQFIDRKDKRNGFVHAGKGYRIENKGGDQYELRIDSKERRIGHKKGQPLIKKSRKSYFTHP